MSSNVMLTLKNILASDEHIENTRELTDKYNFKIMSYDENCSDFASYIGYQKGTYHNFEDKEVITIDPVGSLDLDDGISLEKLKNNNYLLGVYIADVSNYVPFNSCDDIKALRNGETIYSSDGILASMLPDELVIDFCSLLPGNIRKTIVCFFEIEPDGNVKNHFFTRGLIKTRRTHHFSYDDVSYILNNGCPDNKVFDILCNLQRLSSIGQFENMDMEERDRNEKDSAHNIVEKFMILTNHIAALDARDAGVPFIYRAHHINDINGRFSKAYYTTNAVGHDGLGLDAYAHTTSPLRRYADLANHRLIKLFLIDSLRDEKRLYQIDNILRGITNQLNSSEVSANRYDNDYARVLRK